MKELCGFMVQNFEAIQSDDYLKETVEIQFFKMNFFLMTAFFNIEKNEL